MPNAYSDDRDGEGSQPGFDGVDFVQFLGEGMTEGRVEVAFNDDHDP